MEENTPKKACDYYGHLYGRICGKYFKSGKTAIDFDSLELKVKQLQEELRKKDSDYLDIVNQNIQYEKEIARLKEENRDIANKSYTQGLTDALNPIK